jgi:hypothetical protein
MKCDLYVLQNTGAWIACRLWAGLIPGIGRDAFAGVNMPQAPSGVSDGSLCHVQQRVFVKPDR